MEKHEEHKVNKTLDGIQQRLTTYACDLKYEDLGSDTIHAAKARLIDTLGVLIGGFHGELPQIARNFASAMHNAHGATIIGTRWKTTPDLAAFVNATTARHIDMLDTYHWPGSYHGHPSDVITPVLAAAEYANASGRELIVAIVLAYEVYLRISDVVHNENFDNTNFACLASAIAAGKLWGLDSTQLAHCISMAVVPNNALRQVRLGRTSMWKEVASGNAGRAGVFAALLAQAGMEGPHLPFEGRAGWCEHVALKRFSLDTMGGTGAPYKILDSRIKNRPSSVIAPIIAAEKVAPLVNFKDIEHVTVALYKQAKELVGSSPQHWNPDSREAANQSAPYKVAATLIDGTVTPSSFNEARLWDPELRSLMQKIEVVENPEYTRAYARLPREHRAGVIVVTKSGERLAAETGGDEDDLSAPKSDAQIVKKFRDLTEDFLGAKRVNSILDTIWNLDGLKNASAISAALVLI